MKKLLSILSIATTLFSLYAENYLILKINTSSVVIGNKTMHAGDIFKDNDVIHWQNDKQAIKAQNLNSKEIRLFVAQQFKNNNSRSIKDYYVKTNRMSTRGRLSFSDFEEDLCDTTFFLMDTIAIVSPIIFNSTQHCYINYYNSDENCNLIERELKTSGDTIFITRKDLPTADSSMVVVVGLRFMDEIRQISWQMTDNMTIHFIPESLESLPH